MSAATPRLKRMSGPATAYAAPTRRKIAAPTIAPSAAIVMSNRPRSRVTRTRTEADAGPAPDTEGGEWAGYLSLWRCAGTVEPGSVKVRGPAGRLRLRCGFRRGLCDRLAERPEHQLDVLAGLRGAEEIRGLEGLRGLFHLLLTECGLVLQVDFVDRKRDRDLADGPEHGLDPRVEVLEGIVSGDVRHGEDPLRPVEVCLAKELAESLRAHDVPDRHVHLDCVSAFRIEGEFFLGDFRAERHDVSIVVLIQDVAFDQRGLAHGVLAHEADFHLHSPRLDHVGPRRDSRKSFDDLRYSLGSI